MKISRLLKNRQGGALLEFAIVAMILMTLVMGIAEYGLIILDYNRLASSAFAAARAAAAGSTTTEIINTAISAGPGLGITNSDVIIKKGDPGSTDTSTWAAVGDGSSSNDASSGQLIMVTVQCSHHLLTGFFHGGATSITISYSSTTRRE